MIIYSDAPLTPLALRIARGLASTFRAVGEGASIHGYTVYYKRPGVFWVVKDHLDNAPTRFIIQKGR